MEGDRIADVVFILAIITIIVLKITNVITISWFWLTTILWIPLLIGCILALVLGLFFYFTILIDKRRISK